MNALAIQCQHVKVSYGSKRVLDNIDLEVPAGHFYGLVGTNGSGISAQESPHKYCGRQLIAMDAPPDKEDCRPFVDIAGRMATAGLHVPKIYAEDLEQLQASVGSEGLPDYDREMLLRDPEEVLDTIVERFRTVC